MEVETAMDWVEVEPELRRQRLEEASVVIGIPLSCVGVLEKSLGMAG